VKKYFLITLLLVFSSFTFAQAPQKTGYVDSQVILSAYPEAIKAQGDLDGLVKTWNGRIDSMSMALQTEIDNFQKQAATMTPEKQKEVQNTLVGKAQEIRRFQQEKFGQQSGDYFVQQEKLLAQVNEKIMKAIEEVAKEETMDFVFDKSGDILLLYANNSFDITFKVLDKLKRGK